MTARLSLLTIACLFFLFLAVAFSFREHGELNGPFILFIVTLIAIAYTIWSDVDFNITGDFLMVTRPFHAQRKFNLNEMLQWEEVSFPIRGQRRRTLILEFERNEIIEFSNRDHKARYETIYNHLKKNFPLIEKFNMTVMQEIKFNSLHRFLSSDFYVSGDKYVQLDESLNKGFSLEIFRMKIEGADRDRLAERLLVIKTQHLKKHETLNRCQAIADRILDF